LPGRRSIQQSKASDALEFDQISSNKGSAHGWETKDKRELNGQIVCRRKLCGAGLHKRDLYCNIRSMGIARYTITTDGCPCLSLMLRSIRNEETTDDNVTN